MDENNVERQLSSISKASSYEEIGEFWDTHSTADYWDQGKDVEFEIRIPHLHRVVIVDELFERIRLAAATRGVLPETLINLWLAERLQAPIAPVNRRREKKAALRPVVETAERQLAEENASYSAEP